MSSTLISDGSSIADCHIFWGVEPIVWTPYDGAVHQFEAKWTVFYDDENLYFFYVAFEIINLRWDRLIISRIIRPVLSLHLIPGGGPNWNQLLGRGYADCESCEQATVYHYLIIYSHSFDIFHWLRYRKISFNWGEERVEVWNFVRVFIDIITRLADGCGWNLYIAHIFTFVHKKPGCRRMQLFRFILFLLIQSVQYKGEKKNMPAWRSHKSLVFEQYFKSP